MGVNKITPGKPEKNRSLVRRGDAKSGRGKTDTYRCPHADKATVMFFGKDGSAYCRPCWEALAGKGDVNHYTGKKIWLGSEVYGKRLGSDELRADTERDLLKKNFPPWMEERMQKKGLNQSDIRTDLSQ